MSYPSLLFIAVIKCGQKSAWKRRIYFSLQFTAHCEWKSGLAPPTVGWPLPHQPLIEQMLHRVVSRPV